MAKLVAAAPLEPDHFDRLLTIAVPGGGISFTAFTAAGNAYTFTGTGFTYDLSGVLTGTIKGIAEVDDAAAPLFTATGVSLAVTALDFASGSVFAADIMAAAFAGNDSLTGSDGNDTLDGLTGADTVSGGAGDDALLGSGGDDSLAGGDGNDIFDGGPGADRMVGGAGDDMFLVRDTGDVVSEAAEGGHDTVASYVTRTLGNYQEDLVLFGDTAIDGTGNGLANLLAGTPAMNVLNGAGGNDTLIGGGAADALDGGAGNDLLFGQAPYAVEPAELSQTARSYVNARTNALVNGLGGAAGFGENALAAGDDASSAPVDLTTVFGPAGLNFFGVRYTAMYVNNNGNITFDAPLPQFSPDPVTASTLPIIAPFWADVDTQPDSGDASDHVYWDVDTHNGVVTITWNAVGHYDQQALPANSFQLQLVNEGGGDFDMVFRYADISWAKGDDILGAGTVPGVVARAGYSAGNGVSYVELGASGDSEAMLALDETTGNTGRIGTYVFNVRNGNVLAVDDGAPDTLLGGSGSDTLDGSAGADRLDGGVSKDTLTGGGGRDDFVLADPGTSDLITDFAPGKDHIVLEGSFFSALPAGSLSTGAFHRGNAAQDADDRIVYNATSGKLYYDADGAGGNPAQLIATLSQSPDAVSASDFVVV